MPKNPNLPVATLCLYGSDLDPTLVSSEFECEPDCTQRKGQSFVSASGKQRTAETGLWMLHSGRFCTSSDLSDHIDCLVQALRLDSDLRGIRGVDSAVLCLAVVSTDQPELLTLRPESVERLANLGLTLKVAAY